MERKEDENRVPERIATYGRTSRIIEKHGFAFQKRFGQNFLVDSNILEKIVAGAELQPEDDVIEIGPGIGSLTQYLAENCRQVIAIEIDNKLIPILEETLEGYGNVEIVHEDVLKVDLKRLVEERCGNRPVKVVANLPYYITTPIIMGLFESQVPLDSITVMVQKEVADRMQAKKATKEYGALSLAVQYYSDPTIVTQVPPNCFVPRPKVGSTVIRLRKRTKEQYAVADEKLLFQVIRASFNQRRKTLLNSLSHGLHIPKAALEAMILEAGLSPAIRGEALGLDAFVELSNRIAAGSYGLEKKGI
ncbi:16S rRNA (adenine(1518)-N(6)/adenine(1519)-N(6))-dimethyltransferase RsmA [Clostridiales bacterium F-3ap]|uniref:Ribosomal RNA small subunit methyltransferase A n=2 Tax=Anaerotalea alkaliphila TaxID=2662126 RepID=A0A7X5HWQ3_9FIRM|nr:16S rRNA (adenine(1518)-N(6)/adenine(1519)-N(6))-dimethyltransferase RsmA [Anaerotalea alkaliphila]